MALTDKLTAIADAVRAKTGGTELLTLDQMAAAIGGISGGGGVTGLAYDMGVFVFDADKASNQSYNYPITHNLGEKPDFILVWSDYWAGITEAPAFGDTKLTMVGFVWFNGLTGMIGRASSSANITNPIVANFTIQNGDYRVYTTSPTSSSYGINNGILPSSTVFYCATFTTNHVWRAGVTYKYFVSKAWWNIGGVESAE